MLLQDDDLHVNMEDWLAQLNDKQREVVERRFGLNGHKTATLEEVGEEIGVTRERVRQIQMDALKRLRAFWRQNERLHRRRHVRLIGRCHEYFFVAASLGGLPRPMGTLAHVTLKSSATPPPPCDLPP